MIVIVFHYYIWRAHILGLPVKVCWADLASSRPLAEGRELQVPAALLYHSSLHLCQAQPHKSPSPASPPAVALWLTHGTMPTIQLMYLNDSWNLLMPKASSHGYGTIKYICEYSWMKVRFQQDFLREIWKLCVSQAFQRCGCLEVDSPYAAAACSRPAQGLIFTLRRYHFQALDKWVGLFNIWICIYNLYTSCCSSVSPKVKSGALKSDSFANLIH